MGRNIYEEDLMQYNVSGKQIDIGTALQTHVTDALDVVIEKYAERPTHANITFSKSSSEFVSEIVIHLSTGLTAQARAHSHEIYAAFDAAAAKLEKQLRRYKRRLKDHHRERTSPVELSAASSYIIATDESDKDVEPQSLQPVIVAELDHKIPSLSVGEAVMQMELSDAPVVVFNNEGRDSVNVVYRRADGHIGWIDPSNAG